MNTKKERQYKIYQAIDQYKLNEVLELLEDEGIDQNVLDGLRKQADGLRDTLCAVSNDLVDKLDKKDEEIESLQRNLKSMLQVREGKCKSFTDVDELVNDLFEKKMITDKEEMLSCKHGLYKVYWESGGSSVASIGSLHSGDRWIAPTNWTSKESPTGLLKFHVADISALELINV